MLILERIAVRIDSWQLSADLSVPEGAICGLIGPSGAGKSTLLSVIAGFLAPSSGRVLWQGRDLGPLAPGDRPVSMLFQDQNLFPHLTLLRNLGLALDPKLRLGPADLERIETTLDRVGLAGMGGRKPGALSGGQQARAALARALLRARPLLLLDEPFSALGPALRHEMLDLVAEIATQSGATVLLVSHAPEDILRIAGLAILVADGVARGPTSTGALFAAPPPALAEYLGQ